MQATDVTPRQEMKVGASEAPDRLRQVLQMADVSKVSVNDTHGHTIVDVPVDKEGIGSVLEPVVAATRAIADTVGDVTLSIEKQPELPARASSAEGGGSAATGRGGATAGGGGGTVTQQDVERIREANAVPTGDAAHVKRIAPEQKGEPELKDTGEWPDVRQDDA
jgi:hypothetical protein